ncbi:putative efflux protein, MATE family [Pseudonocardia thermophila]|jgi:putative efflux protein, MATE family|uniref:Putative efflux protein, MATE family n=1 Tax=Pseudonocardia thermophila TaxID=1848 RepID=A0A1M6ZAP8_PSETH|nr:MATE family efflux transporter [Pseudonocardia thermophila]SHL27556.1 putative efflux protein, MATE family [Pseudonocardia thermophila]
MTRAPSARGSAADVLRLAVPALPVLAAEPLYLLVDTAVVGRLGAVALAGLAVAGVLFAQVTSALTFLSYGTTARAARLHGAGRRAEAVAEGVQATWLALAVGLVLLVVGQLVAEPVTAALGDGGEIAEAAVSWLRIALLGTPLVLVTLAGNGWMRGVQDTRRPLWFVLTGNGVSAALCPLFVLVLDWGLIGSAWANVCGQTLAAALFFAALVGERSRGHVGLRPQPRVIAAQLELGRDLIARTLAFQVCFLSATAVVTRFGAQTAAAHQIVLQVWMFITLVHDALAIAAQQLVGAALGAGDGERARDLARRILRYGVVMGVVFAVVFAVLSGIAPPWFTPDAAVLAVVPVAWWFLTALQPVSGAVFALDGVLLGAGDAAYLRTTTLAAALVGFLPAIWASLAFGWGLAGVWSGLAAFMLLRLVAVLVRTRSGAWAVPGAVR